MSSELDTRLDAYIDGELEGEERLALEQALAREPGLAARLEELRGLDRELRGLYSDERGLLEESGLVLRLEREARSARRALRWLGLPLAAAAGLVLGLLLRPPAAPAVQEQSFAAVATLATGPFLVDDGQQAPREARAGEFLPAGTRISAPPGVRLALVLADGSELRLDRASALRLASGRAFELESGRVWSRVVPGEPFRIACGAAEVEVHGTELAVEREGERTALQLFQGSAELRAGGAARALAAGQQASWAEGRLSAVERIESEALATGWMLELYAYSGTHERDLADHLDRLLAELGHRKLVSFAERELEAELAGICRVPLARYLVSESARQELEARRKAARVLAVIADTSVALPLAQALGDPDGEVRVSAATALGRLSAGAVCADPSRAREESSGAWVEEARAWAEARPGLR